jgi:D-serine deaminase-like pyridoxal phosphate-dependent protein
LETEDDRRYEVYRGALRGLRLPVAFVDLDLLRANAAALGARSAGKPIRLATKSVRCVALLRLVLDEYPSFRGLMCYTAAEAAWLAGLGFDDILVGYPSLEPSELDAAAAASAERRILFVVDDERQLAPLTEAAQRHGATLPVCVDVDMSSSLPGLHFGVRRSPLTTPEAVVGLARQIASRPALRFAGLLAYEAQIAGVPDAVPGRGFRSRLVRFLKSRSRAEVAARRGAVVAALRHAGLAPQLVNGGGTGSLESTSAEPEVTEVTAGSGLFSPGLFDSYASFRHRPAAAFAVPLTRIPTTGVFTCHGGGYVASGAPGPDKLPRPYLPGGARLLPLEGAGEVQTPIAYSGPVRLTLGDPIFLRHAKAGELCEHFDRLVLLSGGRVVSEVPTYRGEGKCFL